MSQNSAFAAPRKRTQERRRGTLGRLLHRPRACAPSLGNRAL
jgi:hypothetical protein